MGEQARTAGAELVTRRCVGKTWQAVRVVWACRFAGALKRLSLSF